MLMNFAYAGCNSDGVYRLTFSAALADSDRELDHRASEQSYTARWAWGCLSLFAKLRIVKRAIDADCFVRLYLDVKFVAFFD